MLDTPAPERFQETTPKLPEAIFRDNADAPEAPSLEGPDDVDNAPQQETVVIASDESELPGVDGDDTDSSAPTMGDEEPATAETVEQIAPPKKSKTKVFVALGVAAATGVTAIVAGVAGVFGGNRTSAVPQPVPSASAPVTPGPTSAEATPQQSATPAETGEPSSSVTPNESASPTPSSSETVAVKELPSLEAFRKMSPEQRLQAIEDSLPESLLSDPEAVYTRTLKLEELIYNAPTSDEEFKKYDDAGGLDYVGYIMENYYNPLFKKLLGKEPSTNLDDGGALTFAYSAANVLYVRSQSQALADVFTPYAITIDVVSVEEPTSSQAPYTIKGTLSMHDTIDATQAEALANLQDFHVNVVDPSPVEFTMVSVHYDKTAGMIRASQLR